MSNINPFDKCPVYETNNLIFRKVEEEDAIDLFQCYSDPITKNRMNNDNCGGVWDTRNINAVINGIKGWEREFNDRFYIRWSINHKQTNKIVGTIEIAPVPNTTRFLDGACQTGILRIDIISSLENKIVLSEILTMVSDKFYSDFDIKNIIIKATKDDKERVSALENNGFNKLKDSTFPYRDYYVKRK